MHKSHQTRMTGFSNQLSEQHANQIASMKEDYEEQLSKLQEALKQLQEPDLGAEKLLEDQKAEFLAKIEHLESVSAGSKTEFQAELARLKEESARQLEELTSTHQAQKDNISATLKVRWMSGFILEAAYQDQKIGRDYFIEGKP